VANFSAIFNTPIPAAGEMRAADFESDTPMLDIQTLTHRLTAGDEEAFREFHGRYFDRLFRHLLGLTRGDEDEAKEALQETLIRVAKYVRRFDDEGVFWCWTCSPIGLWHWSGHRATSD
jgi:hypothetical protein